MLEYVGIAAGGAAAWSLMQFLQKVANKKKNERWKDFDGLSLGKTVLFSSVGATAGLWVITTYAGVEPGIGVALAAGLYGEKGLELIVNTSEAIFSKIKR